MEVERLVECLRRTIRAYIRFADVLKSGEHMTCPIQLNKRRLAATMAKLLVDQGEDQVAGVLVQMFGSGEPYEVCDE